MNQTLIRLQTVMREVFDDDALCIDSASSPDTIADWDSFANIQLLAAVEEEFGLKFTTAEAQAVRSVADILKKIG